MRLLLAAATLFVMACTTLHADAPAVITDITKALAKAKAEKKVLFLQMGREACGNCAALRDMVKSGEVPLPADKFVYADVNGDDPTTADIFDAKFKVDGPIYPFVVIASPDGKLLASRTGYGSKKDFNRLLDKAKAAMK